MSNADFYLYGKCTEMCPLDEIKLRENEKLIHLLEMVPGTEHLKFPKACRKKMVKSFSRSAAGKEMKSETLRPPSVLLKTVRYLICEVLPTDKLPFYKIYDFITDRLLAVRQDIVVQNLKESEVITILQPIVRFHAYSAYKLCDENISRFDPTLNNKHLQECLKKLLQCYDVYDSLVNIDYILETRPDFEAIYLLFNIGSNEALARALTIPKTYKTTIVKKAINMSVSYKSGNYVKVCRLMKELPILLAALVSLWLPQIRRKAFETMSIAYHSKNVKFPLKTLQDILLYGFEAEMIADCGYYNLKILDNYIHFNRDDILHNKSTIKPRQEFFIEIEELNSKVKDIVLGM